MKLFLTLILFSVVFYGKAQDFKEGLLYDLRGPIKNATINDKFFGARNVSFSEDGKCQPSRMEFDENGYPLGMTIDIRSGLMNNDNDFKGPISYKVDYDNVHRISSIYLHFPSAIDSWEEISNYSYSSDEDCDSEITVLTKTVNKNGLISKNNYVYSDYEYDEYGNWISRNVFEEIIWRDEDGKTRNASNAYLETRTLTYY